VAGLLGGLAGSTQRPAEVEKPVPIVRYEAPVQKSAPSPAPVERRVRVAAERVVVEPPVKVETPVKVEQPVETRVKIEEEIVKEGPVTVERSTVVEQQGREVDVVREERVEVAVSDESVRLTTGLGDLFSRLTTTLSGVTDVASAEAAAPALRELSTAIDSLKASANTLPAEGKTVVRNLVEPNLATLRSMTDSVLALPGVGDVLGTVVRPMIDTLSSTGK
jgi:hypothetical protein